MDVHLIFYSQKMYVLVEGSSKRYGEYLQCLNELKLTDVLQILKSLSDTRWAARCTNLKIVSKCLPAIVKFLDSQTGVDARGLRAAVCMFDFVFAVGFPTKLFDMANVTSQALQASDIDLAAAVTAVENLTTYVRR